MNSSYCCPKCGSGNFVGPVYCSGIISQCNHRHFGAASYQSEHLVYTCAQCQYVVLEPTVDNLNRRAKDE